MTLHEAFDPSPPRAARATFHDPMANGWLAIGFGIGRDPVRLPARADDAA